MGEYNQRRMASRMGETHAKTTCAINTLLIQLAEQAADYNCHHMRELLNSHGIDASTSQGCGWLHLFTTNRHGEIPLHLAAYYCQDSTTELLISAGANLHARNKYGETPLHMAAVSGHLPVVKLLTSAGADVNALDKYGETPLHYAARNGHVSTVQLLISGGATVDTANEDGDTPLHLAARNDHVDTVQLLISGGAAVNIANNDGKFVAASGVLFRQCNISH